MKRNKITYIKQVSIGLLVLATTSCSERDFGTLQDATNPITPDVYTDSFSGCMPVPYDGDYANPTTFNIDYQDYYKGSQSIRIEIPEAGDPKGTWVQGAIEAKSAPRNLAGYNCLTFYAKSSKTATITAALSNGSKYTVLVNTIKVSPEWTKFYIPIPNSSLLTNVTSLFYYSANQVNNTGYSLWFDEIKFETLGTLANFTPQIVGGISKTATAETGDTYTIDGLYETVSLPDGTDQKMAVASGYYTFTSSNTTVATVDASGIVTVLDAGAAVITAKIGNTTATGSLTINSTGNPVLPTLAAPTPTVEAKNVISLFSNTYTNVTVDSWNTHWQYSTAENKDYKVGSDDIKRYMKLNFVGIEFISKQIDASQMTRFHMDFWTPNSTALPAAFKVQLVDFGANGAYGGGDDSSSELSFTSPTLATGKWVSIDVALPTFSGLKAKAHLAQMVFSGDISNVFIDNVYFYNSGNIMPAETAPAPTYGASSVMSIYSDTYTSLTGTDFNPNWGQSTVVSDVTVSGNHLMKYATFNYQGTDLGATTDFSSMKYLHIDVWTMDATVVKVSPISKSSGESLYTLTPLVAGKWNSYDIPLTAFTKGGMTMNDIYQMKFDGQAGVTPSNIYLDNIYFYTVSTTPEQAAPTPTFDAANVISMFSNTYTNVTVDTWSADWDAADLADAKVSSNDAKLYTNLSYAGIEFTSKTIDATNLNYFHLNIWTPDALSSSSTFKIKLVDFGANGVWDGGGDDVEHELTLTTATTPSIDNGKWVTLDIPLSNFTGLKTKAHLAQLIISGDTKTVYVDNVLFHK